jgi:hypothetical protein
LLASVWRGDGYPRSGKGHSLHVSDTPALGLSSEDETRREALDLPTALCVPARSRTWRSLNVNLFPDIASISLGLNAECPGLLSPYAQNKGSPNFAELFTAKAARTDLLSKAGLAAFAAATRTSLALREQPARLELRRRAIAQGAVSATQVIEAFAVVEDQQFGGGFSWRNRVGEAVGFQRGDEALSQGIVMFPLRLMLRMTPQALRQS